MRRLAPRPLRVALEHALPKASPDGLLARVQGAWADAVGEVVNDEAQPVSERDGVVTVACRSSVWAEELKMMGSDLRERVNGSLGDEAVAELRFTASGARRPRL